MPEQIRTITDKGQFPKIFSLFFANNDVFLKTASGDLKIVYMGFADGTVAFKIPYVKNMPDSCVILTRKDSYIVSGVFKLKEKDADDMYVFYPVQFQIISNPRKEERIDLGTGKSVLFITNLISDYILQNSLALSLKKVENIKEILRFDLEKRFTYVKIYFMNEGMSDPRMKYFYANPVPLFVPNMNAQPDAKFEKQFNTYINEIYAKDYLLQNRKNLIAEIAVPVLYHGKIPYGYIQVNSDKPLTDGIFSVIKRLGVVADELFKKNKLFLPETDKLLIADASFSGIGIVFRERKYIRYFKEGSYVIGDMLLPGSTKANVLCVVRNIALMENKIIKVGCQIKDLDALSEVHYHEYLESVGLKAE